MADTDIEEIVASLSQTAVDTGVGDAVPSQENPPVGPETNDTMQSFDEILDSQGTRQETNATDTIRAWMRYHEFVVVTSVEQLAEVVDEAIRVRRCSLDLETQGLDNRIYYKKASEIRGPFEQYWEEGKQPEKILQTVHKIVGYCLSFDGKTGYYAPVRHHNVSIDITENNLDVVAVGKQIRRLCLASQPKLTPEGKKSDPLASALIDPASRHVKIYFWNAKFDQEFLYPITGIDFWHPESFEDAMLAYYCIYTGDKSLSLKFKSKQKLLVLDDKGLPVRAVVREDPKRPYQELVEPHPKGSFIPYVMIELKELFPGRDIKFPELAPGEVRMYACSDAICTYLHCVNPVTPDYDPESTTPFVSTFYQDKKYTGMYRVEKMVSQTLRLMERHRILIDHEYVRALFQEAQIESEGYRKQLLELAAQYGYPNFDPNSPQQVSEFFFGNSKYLNIDPKPEKNEKSNQYKTDADTLEKLAAEPDSNPILITLVKYRQVEKVLSTYLAGMLNNCDPNSEMRYAFKQTGAPTGRFTAPGGEASQGFGAIPIHGIPATYDESKPKVATALRKAFIARPGYTMVKIDFAGEELRIVTNLSQEPAWIKEFNEGTGDLHTITAKAFFGPEITKQQRQMGKCVHPDTLVSSGGLLSPLRFIGVFPNQEDSFTPYTGSIFDGVQDQPLTHLYNGGTKELFHVVISGGILTCTGEHKLKTRDGFWVRVADLQEGLLLEECSVQTVEEGTYPTLSFSLWDGLPPQQFTPTHNLSYFAGLFAGDGTGSKSHVALTHGEPGKLDPYGVDFEEWRSHLEASLISCGFSCSRKDHTSIYFGSTVVVRFLSELQIHRKTTKNLRVPSWVLTSGRTAALHYLGGIFDTDGTVGEDQHSLDWTSKDFVFAGQVSTLLKACGLSFNTELTFNKTYQRYYARLRLTVGSSWAIRDYIRHPGKRFRLREPMQAARTKDRFQVVKVLPAGVGPCLDVTMGTEEHQYQANGFISHNSANFSLVYGGGVQAIMRATKCNPQEAALRKANFDKALPVFAAWCKLQKAKVKRDLGVFSAFGRWMSIPEANSPDKALQASAERCSLNYPIQASGADIMKFALVLLHKEFYKRNWMDPHDPVARFLLTVHDEIVFEVKHEYLMEVMPVLEHNMALPGTFPRVEGKPWPVKLEVEPLLDAHWDPKYDYHKIMKGSPLVPGKKVSDCDIVAGKRVYQKPPPWLEAILIPDYKKSGITPDVKKEPPPPEKPIPEKVKVSTQEQATPTPPETPEVPKKTPKPPPPTSTGGAKDIKKEDVFWYALNLLTPKTAKVVAAICVEASEKEPQGKLLGLIDQNNPKEILIDPSMGIRVDPEMFKILMGLRNM